MALSYSTLRKPVNPQAIDPSTGRLREEWQLYFQQLTDRLNDAVGLGDVFGPASSTDGNLASFDGTDGKTLQDSGLASSGVLVSSDIGSTVQAYDADLDDWSDVNPTDYVDAATLASTSNGDGASLIGIEDSAGNFSSGTVEGALVEANNSTQGEHTKWIAANDLEPRPSAGPSAGTYLVGGTYAVPTYDFDQTTQEDATVLVGMPKSWDHTANIRVQFIWIYESGSGNVEWQAFVGDYGDGDDMGSANFTSLGSVTDAGQGADLLHIAETSGAAPGGASQGDILHLLLRRVAGDAADTLNTDARLLGVRIFFRTNANTDD